MWWKGMKLKNICTVKLEIYRYIQCTIHNAQCTVVDISQQTLRNLKLILFKKNNGGD
jgi:hypothetical protein